MSQTSPYLSKELVERSKAALESLGRTGEISRRLVAIISSYNHSITEVAKIYNTTNKTIRLWIKNFQKSGIEGLKISKGRGRKALLNSEDLDFISKALKSNSTITIEELRITIKQKLGKEVGKTCCHEAIKKCGFSYKTGRKHHYKSNPDKQSEFKKN